jgi:MFS family permease
MGRGPLKTETGVASIARPDLGEPGPEALHRNVWVASGTSFLTDVSSEMILNVLPLFLANVLGVRVWAVGAVEGIADTTAAVVKLLSGWYSDRFRTRKWPAVTGYAMSALVKPLYLMAGSWTAVAGIRWGDRVGKGVRTAPRDALLADSAPVARRGLVFGIHRAADTGGAVVGLLATIWVVQRFQGSGALLDAETFRTLVRWSLFPAFLGVLLLAVGARDVRSPPSTEGASTEGASTERATVPRLGFRGLGRGFGWFVACSVVFQMGNSADAFLVLRAQEQGFSVVGIMWILLAFNVVYASVAVPAGARSDRVGRKSVLLAGWVIYGATYLGFANVTAPSQVVALYLLYGGYHGLVAGAGKAFVSDLVPPGSRGLAYGTYAAAVGVVALPASILAGVLWEGAGSWSGLGPGAPFAFGAATAGVASLMLIVMVPSGRAE